LGVPPSASADEIAHAYRQKAKALHPDVNPAPDASDQFAAVGTAYEVLGDGGRRREYDNERLGSPSWRPPPPSDAPTAKSGAARPRRRRGGGVFVAIVVVVVFMLGVVYLVRRNEGPHSSARTAFASATRTGAGTISFSTPDGRHFVVDDPTAKYGDTRAGTKTFVYYDPKHPEDVAETPFGEWSSAFHRMSWANRLMHWYNTLYLLVLIAIAVVVYRSAMRRSVY
jgi:curved DNA-binding protein CbpA